MSRGGRPTRGPGREAGCAARSRDAQLPLLQPGWARGLQARSPHPPGDAVNLVAYLQNTARFSTPISQVACDQAPGLRVPVQPTPSSPRRSPPALSTESTKAPGDTPPSGSSQHCAGWRRRPLRARRAAPRCSHFSSFFSFFSLLVTGELEKQRATLCRNHTALSPSATTLGAAATADGACCRPALSPASRSSPACSPGRAAPGGLPAPEPCSEARSPS